MFIMSRYNKKLWIWILSIMVGSLEKVLSAREVRRSVQISSCLRKKNHWSFSFSFVKSAQLAVFFTRLGKIIHETFWCDRERDIYIQTHVNFWQQYYSCLHCAWHYLREGSARAVQLPASCGGGAGPGTRQKGYREWGMHSPDGV